jgi:RNA polymerase sigma factor (sigma-70 family)
MQEWTDKQLIDCWQANRNQTAFQILHDRRKPRLVRYVRKCLHGYFKDFAEEIVEAVFTDLHAAKSSFFRDASVDSWLHVVADRQVEDFLRKQHREKRDARRTVELSALQSPTTHEDGPSERVPDGLVTHVTPEHLACQREMEGLASRLINRLACQERAVLTKVCIDGQSVKSAAESLGISRRTARQCVARAREKLSKMHEIRELVGEPAEEPSPECESTRAAGRSLLQNLPKIILILLAVIGSVADACDPDVYRGVCTAEDDKDELLRQDGGHHHADKQRRKSLMRLPLRPVAAVAGRPVLDQEHPSVRARQVERRKASTLLPDFGPSCNDRKDGGLILLFRTAQSARSPSKVPRDTTLEAA